MNPDAWVALVIGGIALLLNLVTLAVGYGLQQGAAKALAGRVTALEGEMTPLNELKVKVAEIATRQETWIEQLKDLNASIRWMRKPAEYDDAMAAPPARPRR